ncbi:hypothetical protein PTSG_05850 [Salpingoeca rosetta]|uniref:Sulfotransferase domain-containing protein n=1 Tax=Salpingoeca rosetta (strain ATCC 50818 / BSB-021) TaxID=946362 RepID=F2UCZ1_SALR5|nr:uncharacterized protein PTSG_05850 [Salpingoeca rosetta]EGD74486.1 hypothetical protein PTSG_05850 [Salpingoeca rosetta]|eukprot:XP_004992743.1 hypothetical protein PTSG_05850 [Salpingoeca rosetta]
MMMMVIAALVTLTAAAVACLTPHQCAADSFPAGQQCPSNHSLKLVYSHYHGNAHCVCPLGEVCVGSACSVGQAQNGHSFQHNRHGFQSTCEDCHCLHQEQAPDFSTLRDRHILWILGTHHKTGSFLTQNMWGTLRRLVSPPLKIFSSQFRPITEEQWRQLGDDVDVVVTFHAQHINQTLLRWIERPYRFVHIVRDPVAAIVSAYLYETQRPTAHDNFHKVAVHAPNMSAGLRDMADAMQPELLAMEEQFAATERDHFGLNVKLEDFTTNFNDTIHRIFRSGKRWVDIREGEGMHGRTW